MAFDWKMFAASFLDEVTEGIEERGEEAKEYKEKMEEAAERNRQLVNQRTVRANEAAQYGRRAMQLGASEAQVRTAMSSGMKGVAELYQKLEAAANQKGMKQLGVDDIEAIVTMPNIPAVNQSLKDIESLEEFARETFGARGLAQKPEESNVSTLGKLFNVGAKDRVKSELANTPFGDGMTIADVNAIARQKDYQSMFPDATMTFLDVPYFSSEKALDFSQDLVEAMDDGVNANEAAIKAAANEAINNKEDPVIARAEATQRAREDAAEQFIEAYANTYQAGGFFDNVIAAKSIIAATDVSFFEGLLEDYGIEANEQIQSLIESKKEDTIEKDPNKKDPEKKKANPKAEEEKMATKKRIEGNVYYLDDDGKVVNGVPPKPELGLMNVLGGAGLGGDTIEEIYKGDIAVPKNLRPGQWDEIFGEFYNDDGTPK